MSGIFLNKIKNRLRQYYFYFYFFGKYLWIVNTNTIFSTMEIQSIQSFLQQLLELKAYSSALGKKKKILKTRKWLPVKKLIYFYPMEIWVFPATVFSLIFTTTFCWLQRKPIMGLSLGLNLIRSEAAWFFLLENSSKFVYLFLVRMVCFYVLGEVSRAHL